MNHVTHIKTHTESHSISHTNTRTHSHIHTHTHTHTHTRIANLDVTVWIGLLGNGSLLGPFFFEQTVNGERYLRMIDDQVVPALNQMERFRRQRNGPFRHIWWARDGAPAHRTRIVMTRLRELFGNRIIALNEPVEWPRRSPDLTPLDFFVSGYLQVSGVPEPTCEPQRPTREDQAGLRARHLGETGACFVECFRRCSIALESASKGTEVMSRSR